MIFNTFPFFSHRTLGAGVAPTLHSKETESVSQQRMSFKGITILGSVWTLLQMDMEY